MKKIINQKKLAPVYKILESKLGIDILISLVATIVFTRYFFTLFIQYLLNQEEFFHPENGFRKV